MRLEDSTIIVTGGASGIGRALCLAFAAEGARVVVGDVRRDQLHVGGTPTDWRSARPGASRATSRPTCARARTSTAWSRRRSSSATAAST